MQRFAKQQAAFEEAADALPSDDTPRASNTSNTDEAMPDAPPEAEASAAQPQPISDGTAEPAARSPARSPAGSLAALSGVQSVGLGSPLGVHPIGGDASRTCALCHEELITPNFGGS